LGEVKVLKVFKQGVARVDGIGVFSQFRDEATEKEREERGAWRAGIGYARIR